MREIKYRVWSEMYRKMFDCIALMLLYSNGNVRVKVYDKPDCREFDTVFDYVQVSTGLKDKNKKEIYEGDIVRYISSDDEYRPEGVVRMDKCMWRVFWKKDATRTDENFRKDLYFWATEREIEVIGNIYENPELLEI